ncbi:hypothetical protein L484_002685 [Morus notabilis]|uniref:Uncharacterized protein n=1 Tax=Morus notabilis TaxID=981085 RepID=W9RSI8_9ROSA|nr:hypothetical protein L484_002685 [Morus notabilis]
MVQWSKIIGSVTNAAWTTFMEGGLRRMAGHGDSVKKKRRGETLAALCQLCSGRTTTRRRRDNEGGCGRRRGAEEQGRGLEDDEQLGGGGVFFFFFLLFFLISNGKRRNGKMEDRKEALVG